MNTFDPPRMEDRPPLREMPPLPTRTTPLLRHSRVCRSGVRMAGYRRALKVGMGIGFLLLLRTAVWLGDTQGAAFGKWLAYTLNPTMVGFGGPHGG